MATTLKLPNVIEPSKLILEDFEIIAFEKEEELDYYSYWHDKFRGKSFDDLIQQRPRQKTQQQQPPQALPARQQQQQPVKSQSPPKPVQLQQQQQHQQPQQHQQHQQQQQQQQAQPQSQTHQPKLAPPPTVPAPRPQHELPIIRHHQSTIQDGKVLMKYKLTKLYNKFRGRQMRRNLVLDRQKQKRINTEVDKSKLNSWLAYTALQALRLPDSNINQLSTIAINNNPKFITIPQVNNAAAAENSKNQSSNKKKGFKRPQTPSAPTTTPMHYVYLDPNDIVTYSNRICPQQIVAYRKRSHLLPSLATSKKSSAASYDAYEIMEVLANSDSTNVTITRNANKPAPAGCSIYSHSINNNTKTPGIVSTQLHLQARSYLDTVAKYYSDEAIRLEEEEEKLKEEFSVEKEMSKYIKFENSF